ncbi:MAG: glycosyltransferase [Leptolyngbyaceae cyanobacterium RM1_406_9]|nr:glycosyltransferase [Leptolyngbyaceae cyanobacterium RM1_406_9]
MRTNFPHTQDFFNEQIYADRVTKRKICDRFEALSSERDRWQKKASYYYAQQYRYYQFLIPESSKVLELGCGLGDLLAAVKPSRGVGVDFSEKMIEQANQRHIYQPNLEFIHADLDILSLDETFDVIIICDTIGHLVDVETTLKSLQKYCTSQTRIIISYYNFLWEPILRLAEVFHLKMPQLQMNWLSSDDIANLLNLADYEVIKRENRFLIPKKIPILSNLCNRYLATLPIINSLCLSTYLVAKPHTVPPQAAPSTTIVIPCRNEKGNIESAVQRLPQFGGHQEIIFVDGHSTDGTVEEINRVIATYPNKTIRLLLQEGKGKGDAVRKGFTAATNDILMILDADLTVPPEDLPKFYQAIVSGKGEFINGCRLVYPMESNAMRFINLLGNQFFSSVFSWLLNQPIKDTLCGTKVMYREDYLRLAANRHYFGGFDPFGDFDLLLGAYKLNLRILEVPIRYRERIYGTTNIQRFKHGWLLLRMVIFAFRKLKAL